MKLKKAIEYMRTKPNHKGLAPSELKRKNRAYSDLTADQINQCKEEVFGMIIKEPTSSNERSINKETGTISSTIELDYLPKTDEEVALLHKVDLDKYKIIQYYSKMSFSGKFRHTLNCKLKEIGDNYDPNTLKADLIKIMGYDSKVKSEGRISSSVKSTKTLVVFCADEHVGAYVEPTALYTNDWNSTEYNKRKHKIVDKISELELTYGHFDELVYCSLGDNIDSNNGYTTRGGHQLPSNMTNTEALNTYYLVNKHMWKQIVDNKPANTYKIYNMNNSNHGGYGLDYAGNLAVKVYLETAYKNFFITDFDKMIGSFSIYNKDIHITHGKDEQHQKRNFPYNLDAKTESYFKQYLDINGFRDPNRQQIVIKGDLHKSNYESHAFFDYINMPSLFGSSGWAMANFKMTKPGFGYMIIDKNDTDNYILNHVHF